MNLLEFKLLIRKKYNWDYVFLNANNTSTVGNDDVEVTVVENEKIVYIKSPSKAVLNSYLGVTIDTINYKPLILKQLDANIATSLSASTAYAEYIDTVQKIESEVSTNAVIFALVVSTAKNLTINTLVSKTNSKFTVLNNSVYAEVKPAKIETTLLPLKGSISLGGNLFFRGQDIFSIVSKMNLKIANVLDNFKIDSTLCNNLLYGCINTADLCRLNPANLGVPFGENTVIRVVSRMSFGGSSYDPIGLWGKINYGKITQLADLDNFSLNYTDCVYDTLFATEGKTSVRNLEHWIL